MMIIGLLQMGGLIDLIGLEWTAIVPGLNGLMQGTVCGTTTKREGSREVMQERCCRCSDGTDYNCTLICQSTSKRSHVAGQGEVIIRTVTQSQGS